MTVHVLRRTGEAAYQPVCAGFARWPVVDEAAGAVHTEFALAQLDAGAEVPARVQSFEECFYVLDGAPVLQQAGAAIVLAPGDYGLIPVGTAHSWRNESAVPARWAQMRAPQPRARYDGDSVTVAALPWTAPRPVDVRDPRTTAAGHIEAGNMDPTRQSQGLLAVSASMRTALLVYSGITVKMMVDSDLGAQLTTMFMVQYEAAGVAGPHDHPFEETYYFLEGRALGRFDDVEYELEPGDTAFAGVGCVHSFRNLGDGPLRWLETQAPQPPGRHSYRFARDWEYLRSRHG